MAAWWPGDGNANDIVDGNSGSYSGAFAAGKVGQAFSFDGAHEVVITHTSVLLTNSECQIGHFCNSASVCQ